MMPWWSQSPQCTRRHGAVAQNHGVHRDFPTAPCQHSTCRNLKNALFTQMSQFMTLPLGLSSVTSKVPAEPPRGNKVLSSLFSSKANHSLGPNRDNTDKYSFKLTSSISMPRYPWISCCLNIVVKSLGIFLNLVWQGYFVPSLWPNFFFFIKVPTYTFYSSFQFSLPSSLGLLSC